MTDATGPETPTPLGSSDSNADAELESVLESLVVRLRRGERPSLDDIAEQHPRLSSPLRELLPALELIDEIRRVPSRSDRRGERQALPARLGDYRILGELGRGGMGVVYEAFQESLERRVALKVLPFHALTRRASVERFRTEAKLAACLSHPNIVAIHGLLEDRGIHYFAMQLIEGRGLDDLVRTLAAALIDPGSSVEPPDLTARDPLSSSIALRLLGREVDAGSAAVSLADTARRESIDPSPIPELLPSRLTERLREVCRSGLPPEHYSSVAILGAQAADGLAYAHARGVLHRDVKPSNLLVDVEQKLWITDFGLAKAEDSPDLTATGEIVGTLRYMAPERFRGETDARSDIYSLGLTLLEFATLETPFAQASGDELLHAIQAGALDFDSKAARRPPDRLMAALRRALAVDPRERYGSASEFAEDMRLVAAGSAPLHALTRTPRSRRSQRSRKQRLWATLGYSALAAVVFAAAIFGLLGPERRLLPSTLIVTELDAERGPRIIVPAFAFETGKGTKSDDTAPGCLFLFGGGEDHALKLERSIPLGLAPIHLVSADFDGDGHPDLAVADRGTRSIHILTGRDQPAFSESGTVVLDSAPLKVVAGDFDLDGDADLAALLLSSEHLDLIRNSGDGVFERHGSVTVGAGAMDLRAGDIDGDGSPDLIVSTAASSDAGSIIVFFHQSEWSFAAKTFPARSAPGAFVLADLDLDGGPDVAVTHGLWESERGVSVYLHRGRDGLSEQTWYPLPHVVECIAAGDVTGDGRPDLVAAGDDAYVCLLVAGPDGVLAPPVNIGSVEYPDGIGVLDLDRDGKLDIAVSSAAPAKGSVHVFWNRGEGAFERGEALPLVYRPWRWSKP
jgi:serine/threonine protein kinase